LEPLILVTVGLTVGFLGSLMGIGGTIILVPFLLLLGYDVHATIGTSLLVALLVGLSCTFAYFRQKRVDWLIGFLSVLITMPMSSVGAYATAFFSPFHLRIALVVVLILVAAFMLIRSTPEVSGRNKCGTRGKEIGHKGKLYRKLVDSSGVVFKYTVDLRQGLSLLFLAGFLSGLLGVTGGTMLIPIYSQVMGLPIHLSVATSLFTVVFTAVSGSFVHLMIGNIMPLVALQLTIGSLIGTQLGASVAKRCRPRQLARGFGLFVLLLALLLLFF